MINKRVYDAPHEPLLLAARGILFLAYKICFVYCDPSRYHDNPGRYFFAVLETVYINIPYSVSVQKRYMTNLI